MILALVSKRTFSGNRLAAVTGYTLYQTLGELMMPTVVRASRLLFSYQHFVVNVSRSVCQLR